MNIVLGADDVAVQTIDKIKRFYGTRSNAEVIWKAIALLNLAIDLNKTNGRIVAVQGQDTTTINLK